MRVTNAFGAVQTGPFEIAVRLCAAYVFMSSTEASTSPPTDCSLATALNQIQTVRDTTDSWVHQALGFALAATGHADDARIAFNRVTYAGRKAPSELVSILAQTGNLDLATLLIDKIEDSRERKVALLNIARAQAANGDIAAASETVDQIVRSSWAYFSGLTGIVHELFVAGSTEEAGTFLSEHTGGLMSWAEKHADDTRPALWKIAETQALLEDFSAATKTAKLYDSLPNQRRLNVIPNNLQLEVAIWQAQTGDLSGALQRLESVPLLESDRYPWDDIVFEILTGAIHAGALSEVGGEINLIHDKSLRLRLLLELDSAQAKANNHDRPTTALNLMTQLAEETDSSIIGASTLSRLAVRLYESGRKQEAREHLATVIELASHGNSDRVGEIWVDVAIAQAKMDDIDACIETLNRLEQPYVDSAVSSSVRQLAEKGDFDNALTLIKQSQNYYTRAASLVEIALFQNRNGDMERAIQTFHNAYQTFSDFSAERSMGNLDDRRFSLQYFKLLNFLQRDAIGEAMREGYIHLALRMAKTLAVDPHFGDSPFRFIVRNIQKIITVYPTLFEVDVKLIEATREIKSQSAQLAMLASIVALAHQAENWRQKGD